jgi:branched-chain amino acid transport system substrate-binding protein
MNKKNLIGIIALVVIILISVVLAGNNSDKIKIGVISPMTGPLAEYGIAFTRGIELAKLDLDLDNVEFIFEDSMYDPKIATSTFKKLVEVDNVDLIIDWGAATSLPLASLSAEIEMPFVSFSIEPDVSKISSFAIRGGWASADDFAVEYIDLFKTKSYDKIAIVKTDLSYLNYLITSIEKLSDAEIVIVDNYNFGDSDFKNAILKIKDENYDAVGVFLASGQISEFYKQSTELGLKIETFGSDFFESQDEINNANGLMDGSFFPNMEVSNIFRSEYKLRYGDESQITFAGQAYDFANLTKELDFTSKETILSSLKSITEFEGVLGTYNYTEVNGDKYYKVPIEMKKIENGVISYSN